MRSPLLTRRFMVTSVVETTPGRPVKCLIAERPTARPTYLHPFPLSEPYGKKHASL